MVVAAKGCAPGTREASITLTLCRGKKAGSHTPRLTPRQALQSDVTPDTTLLPYAQAYATASAAKRGYPGYHMLPYAQAHVTASAVDSGREHSVPHSFPQSLSNFQLLAIVSHFPTPDSSSHASPSQACAQASRAYHCRTGLAMHRTKKCQPYLPPSVAGNQQS